MLRAFIGALFLVLSATSAAAQKFTFPIDPALGDKYVSDATLTAAIPELRGASSRLSTCINSMIIPPSGTIEFAPTVIGDHGALTNRLSCKIQPPGSLSCEAQSEDQRAVVFDRAPSEYFVMSSPADLHDALTIFRAFRAAKVEFAEDKARPWINRLPLREIARTGGDFEVSFSDYCGCSTKLSVELYGEKIVITRVLHNFCI